MRFSQVMANLIKHKLWLTRIGTRGIDKKPIAMPFVKNDCIIYRKAASTENVIREFAPALCTRDQTKVFRLVVQVLGNLCARQHPR